MAKYLFWRGTVGLIWALMTLVIFATNGFTFCVHRDTLSIEIPPDSDTYVEECCDGRPAHWATSAMPIPVYIYSGSPPELEDTITDAVQAWNNIESSFFEMQMIGYTTTQDPIPGALVIGFDTTKCPDGGDPCLYGATGASAVSVGPSWDDYQIPQATVIADAEPWRDFPGRPNPLWVMMHEMGHVLGIMHPDVNPHGPGGQGCGQPFFEATMDCCDRQGRDSNGQIIMPPTADVATLELDDIAAATSLYPKWKYTVEVVDSSNNPIQGAEVWMDGTCFPHDGMNREEGGMVFGDIPSCLVGDQAPSPTYHPEITYATGPNGKTGEFRVMHNEFCFEVVAEGYVDSYGCQPPLDTLPGYGTANYITTVVMNKPPVCDANGPYAAECQGMTTITLDGTGSSDPDPGDTLSYAWNTDCPDGIFDDSSKDTPILTITSAASCNGFLTVTDGAGASDTCLSTVTIQDTLDPSITCPSNTTIECDQTPDPALTGTASATDVCDPSVTITFSDTVAPGICPEESTITRTWTATDASWNSSSCVQTIEVVDTTAPDIQCNAPATITPPDAPISFTATATDNCAADPSVEILGYDCFTFIKKGKKIDKTESCIVEVNGDTITITDSGGVDDNITWTVRANDNCGNVRESTCSVVVVNPE